MLSFDSVIVRLFWHLAQLLWDCVGFWLNYCHIILAFDAFTGRLCWPLAAQLLWDCVGFWLNYCHIILAFDAFTGRLCWPLATQLLGDYVGLWRRSYREIMWAFSAISVRLCWFFAQLLPHCVGLWRSYWEIILVFDSITDTWFWPLAHLLGDHICSTFLHLSPPVHFHDNWQCLSIRPVHQVTVRVTITCLTATVRSVLSVFHHLTFWSKCVCHTSSLCLPAGVSMVTVGFVLWVTSQPILF